MVVKNKVLMVVLRGSAMRTLFCMKLIFYAFDQRPEAPQGRMSPVEETGSPISSEATVPPKRGHNSVDII